MRTFDRLREHIADQDPITWVITGDSITQGLRHTNGARSYPEHLHEIIRSDLGRRRDALVNTAISGHRLADILDDFTHRVARWSPQVVTIMIGTNDCAVMDGETYVEPGDFAASLSAFLLRVEGLGAIPVVQTPPPVDAAGAPNRARLPEFADATRDAAAAAGAVLVDQHHFFLELGGDRFPWPLLDDPFHPGALGHAALAVGLAAGLGLPADLPTLQQLRGGLRARGMDSSIERLN